MLSLCEHRFPLFNFILQELGLTSAPAAWGPAPKTAGAVRTFSHLGGEAAEFLLHVVQDLDLQAETECFTLSREIPDATLGLSAPTSSMIVNVQQRWISQLMAVFIGGNNDK